MEEQTTILQIIKYTKSKDFVLKTKKDLRIIGFKPILLARKGDMTFCSAVGKKGLELIGKSRASLIICNVIMKKEIKRTNASLLFVDRPRLWFLRCVGKFTPFKKPVGIHETAIIESKKIGRNVYVGPFAYIGKNVTIGDNSRIYGHVCIYGNSRIGKNVVIYPSAVIGSDGFGFEKNEENEWEKFPHLGGVKIHDNVEIGACTCIDRGTLEDTIIGYGTKIDNLVHIAHNVKIGRNCLVVAQCMIAGGCILGDNVHVAMSSTIRDGIRIGENALIGMGSVVTKDIMSGSTAIGVPARPMKRTGNKRNR
ncbi:MAG: UDP-3-O-(3-hydroxymyristoyl)glucosamine N-acyltransferase [Thaumarchaeota archaeon]|nr:UDP-3-O-(3-hydroxymyristoyl)glucosamine N-acyltransferase [Nitrososphaerota archaeon]